MIIKDNADFLEDFSKASVGNIIKFEGKYYIVIEDINNDINCIDLMTGEVKWIFPLEKVRIYEDIELIIKG